MPLSLRFGARIGLSLAIVCLPLLLPEHVHRAGIEGRTVAIVHAHPVTIMGGGDCGASLGRSHGDHGLAVFLASAYDAVRGAHPQPMVASAAPLQVPQRRQVGVAAALTLQVAHGPPGSPFTRGPPRSL